MSVLKINDINIIPAPKGTDAQYVFNYERRKNACKYLKIDVALCDVPLGTKYILCVDGVVVIVEPTGAIVYYIFDNRHIVYPNGDAIQIFDGVINDLEFDAPNKMPDDEFRKILTIATRELLFNPATVEEFIKKYQFTYNKRSIEDLTKCIDARRDAVDQWYARCSAHINKLQIKDLSVARKYLKETACIELWFDTKTTNYIIDRAMAEIAQLI